MTRLLFILFILFAQTSLAQSRSFDCHEGGALSATEAQSLVAEVQENYATITSLSAAFEQESYLASLEISETSSGTMSFLKPGSMKWIYKTPEAQTFLLTTNTVYLYQPVDNQLVIDSFEKVVLSDLPVSFIMGIGDLTRELKLLSACKAQDGISLTFLPRRKEGELQELKLLVSTSSLLTIGGKVTDSSGNVTAVVFKNIAKNPPISSVDFKPAFPDGTDVTDRRGEHD